MLVPTRQPVYSTSEFVVLCRINASLSTDPNRAHRPLYRQFAATQTYSYAPTLLRSNLSVWWDIGKWKIIAISHIESNSITSNIRMYSWSPVACMVDFRAILDSCSARFSLVFCSSICLWHWISVWLHSNLCWLRFISSFSKSINSACNSFNWSETIAIFNLICFSFCIRFASSSTSDSMVLFESAANGKSASDEF